MAKPAVLFGGPSPEHDVSILTGLQALRALDGATAVYWSKDGSFWEVDAGLEAAAFADGVPRKAGPLRLVAGEGLVGKRRPLELSAVVNCCHGGPGEDGTLQGALDLAGIAYTGPTAAGAALGMDKLAFGNVVIAAGLPSLPRLALTPATTVPWDGPSIVKPRFGGSSIGIAVVADTATAVALLASSPHLRGGAVIEPYRADAFDLNVAVRTWPQLELSAIERPVRKAGGAFLGYQDKYLGGDGMASAPRELPAVLPAGVAGRVDDMARTVAGLAGVRGVARIDFLAAGDGDGIDDLYVNEINTIPGSLARYLWVDPVVAFRRLLDDLLDEATRRPSFSWSTQGADGTALRAAGSIAGKLA